jgi:hypothetical protein
MDLLDIAQLPALLPPLPLLIGSDTELADVERLFDVLLNGGFASATRGATDRAGGETIAAEVRGGGEGGSAGFSAGVFGLASVFGVTAERLGDGEGDGFSGTKTEVVVVVVGEGSD